MKYIAHRINTAVALVDVPRDYGVEIDLRDHGTRLILNHDPFGDGEDLEDYLRGFSHSTLILNIKSERIEWRVLELMRSHGIEDYFFLDCSFPMIRALVDKGERRVALRFSEYEGLDTVLAMKGQVDWVWVDCFTRLPLCREKYLALKVAGFKLCFVSPELQGRPLDIGPYRYQLQQEGIIPDAVCTKLAHVPDWAPR